MNNKFSVYTIDTSIASRRFDKWNTRDYRNRSPFCLCLTFVVRQCWVVAQISFARISSLKMTNSGCANSETTLLSDDYYAKLLFSLACSNDLFYFMNLLSIFFTQLLWRWTKKKHPRILFNANKEINKRCFVPRDTTPQNECEFYQKHGERESFESEKRCELLCLRIIYELP